MAQGDAHIAFLQRQRRAQRARLLSDTARIGHWSGMMAGLNMVEQRINEGHGFAQALRLARADIEMLYPVLVGELEVVDG